MAVSRFICVRLRRGRWLHAISEGADSPRETFCGRNADGGVIESGVPDCIRCREWIERSRGR
jgi:hypothetical protein